MRANSRTTSTALSSIIFTAIWWSRSVRRKCLQAAVPWNVCGTVEHVCTTKCLVFERCQFKSEQQESAKSLVTPVYHRQHEVPKRQHTDTDTHNHTCTHEHTHTTHTSSHLHTPVCTQLIALALHECLENGLGIVTSGHKHLHSNSSSSSSSSVMHFLNKVTEV